MPVLDPALIRQYDKKLEESVESPDPEKRHTFAKDSLRKRLEQMVPIGEDTYADRSLLNHAEYQLFLDAYYRFQLFLDAYDRFPLFHDAYYRFPLHWSTNLFPKGLGLEPAVGLKPSDADAFCRWLTLSDMNRSGEWNYRLPCIGELDQDHFTRGRGGYWAKGKLDYTLVWIRDIEPAIPSEVFSERIASELKEFPDLAKIYDFAQECALNFNQAVEFIRAYGFEIIGSEDLGDARAIALDDARRMAFSSNHIYIFVDLITNNQVKDSESARKYAKRLILEIIKGVTLVFITLSFYLSSFLNQNFGGAFGAVIALSCIFKLFHDLPHKLRIAQSCRKSLAIADEYSLDVEKALKVYAAAMILEERSKGNLPAHEGICLVKERKLQPDVYSKTR